MATRLTVEVVEGYGASDDTAASKGERGGIEGLGGLGVFGRVGGGGASGGTTKGRKRRPQGRRGRVAWYRGASERTVLRAALRSVGLSPELHDRVVLSLPSGDEVASISQEPVPPCVHLNIVHPRLASRFWGLQSFSDAYSLHQTSSGLQDPVQELVVSDLPLDPSFQGQYLKLERVLSHLANERTWLAWLRAALTLLSMAFSLWRIYASISGALHPVVRVAIFALILGYLLIIVLTVGVGWLRYERTKYILNLPNAILEEFFGSIGVKLQAVLLGGVMALSMGCYWCLGYYYHFIS